MPHARPARTSPGFFGLFQAGHEAEGDGEHPVHWEVPAIAAGGAAVRYIGDFQKSAHFPAGSRFVEAVISNGSRQPLLVQELEDQRIEAGRTKRIVFSRGTRTLTLKSPDGATNANEVTVDLIIEGCACP